jgi:NAD(P)-dependent dehydrogenase (short-subunit alcohol dehydrogenase family)
VPTAVVWGANGGIGQAVVASLQHADYKVIACSRRAIGSNTMPDLQIEADPANEFSVQETVLLIAQVEPLVDVILYCAGDIHVEKVADLNLAAWQQMFNANLTGAFLVTKHSLPLLRNDGTLLFLDAPSERLQLTGMAAYAASKAGLELFAAALAKEERQRRIVVIRPGAVDTPFWQKVPLRLPKNALQPEEIAARICQIIQSQESGIIDV